MVTTIPDIRILCQLVEYTEKKGFRLVSISFLIVSVATVVSLVNSDYCYADPDQLEEDGFIVTSIDVLNDMHNININNNKVHNIVGATLNNNNNDDDEEESKYHQQYLEQERGFGNTIAKISGEEAKRLIDELSVGTMIHFKITTDENGNDIVELLRDYA